METDKAAGGEIADTQQRRTPSPKTRPWLLRLSLFHRRTIWWPTPFGFFLLVATLVILAAGWLNYGESLLALKQPLPADVLVVEGWIGRDGIRAAVDEFEHGGYRYIVATGGLTSGRWEDEPTSYAVMAAREMIRLGVPNEKVVIATAESTESHRTYESAVAVWRALRDAGIKATMLNVFTLGPHARRSALVFAKVNSGVAKIGVIGWLPAEYKAEPWWRSSERSRELLDETFGYLYEALLNSGRRSNVPSAATRF
jgi:uncharacterized SAM-binding protein YcdF (DUF218 family)